MRMPAQSKHIGRSLFVAFSLLVTGHFYLSDALAHDAENHAAVPTDTPPTTTTNDTPKLSAFPVDLGGAFQLIDHNGRQRSNEDFAGQHPLVFFGYAKCESICPVALKVMLDAVDALGSLGEKLQPILITIDPENETPAVLAAELPKLHPRLLGLTGDPAAITHVRKLFSVNAERTGTSRTGSPQFAHGSFVYLLDQDGKVVTLLPPIFSGATMAEKLRPYLL